MFEYSPAPEAKSIVKFQDSYGHYIGGKFVKSSKKYETINPATEEVLATISYGGAKKLTLRSKPQEVPTRKLGASSPDRSGASIFTALPGSFKKEPGNSLSLKL